MPPYVVWIPNLLLSLLLLIILGGIATVIALFAVIGQLPSIGVLDDPNSLGFKTAQNLRSQRPTVVGDRRPVGWQAHGCFAARCLCGPGQGHAGR